MKEKTAVEWLAFMLEMQGTITPLDIKQAIQIENEQKHSEYMRGWYDGVDITK
jgi:hypothetical protein